jgi:hypothetical protein
MYESKTSISAWLKCVVVQSVSFSIAAIGIVQKSQLHHSWNVLWSKSSDSAWQTSVSALLECVVVKNVSFSILEYVLVKNVYFSIA